MMVSPAENIENRIKELYAIDDRRLSIGEFVSHLTENVKKWGDSLLKEKQTEREYEESADLDYFDGPATPYSVDFDDYLRWINKSNCEGMGEAEPVQDQQYDFDVLLEQFTDQL